MSSFNVCARFRAQNTRELEGTGKDCVKFKQANTIVVSSPDTKNGTEYKFDQIFPPTTTQTVVYDHVAKPLIDDVFEGYNCTIFAYGQTGSGKTYTMIGASEPESKGIVPRVSEHIYSQIGSQTAADDSLDFEVNISYIEIYMERIRDLFSTSAAVKNVKGMFTSSLRVREDKARGIWIEGVEEKIVTNAAQILELLAQGNEARAVGSHQMNQHSSRSHAIFIFTLQRQNILSGTRKTGKLYTVDLAGSEMVRKTKAQGQTLEEAKYINKSLSALGNVISVLTEGGGSAGKRKSKHVPYRDSKLTRVLQDSLGGNSKTSLIVTCTVSSLNITETLSSLRFGAYAQHIQNKPRVNEERSLSDYKQRLQTAEDALAKLTSYLTTLAQSNSSDNSGSFLPIRTPSPVFDAPISKSGECAVGMEGIQLNWFKHGIVQVSGPTARAAEKASFLCRGTSHVVQPSDVGCVLVVQLQRTQPSAAARIGAVRNSKSADKHSVVSNKASSCRSSSSSSSSSSKDNSSTSSQSSSKVRKQHETASSRDSIVVSQKKNENSNKNEQLGTTTADTDMEVCMVCKKGCGHCSDDGIDAASGPGGKNHRRASIKEASTLFLCDGNCGRYMHPRCVGLKTAPDCGEWFCFECESQRRSSNSSDTKIEAGKDVSRRKQEKGHKGGLDMANLLKHLKAVQTELAAMHKEKKSVEARWRMEREMTSAIDNRKREHRKKINQEVATLRVELEDLREEHKALQQELAAERSQRTAPVEPACHTSTTQDEQSLQWLCAVCNKQNLADSQACVVCGKAKVCGKPVPAVAAAGETSMADTLKQSEEQVATLQEEVARLTTELKMFSTWSKEAQQPLKDVLACRERPAPLTIGRNPACSLGIGPSTSDFDLGQQGGRPGSHLTPLFPSQTTQSKVRPSDADGDARSSQSSLVPPVSPVHSPAAGLAPMHMQPPSDASHAQVPELGSGSATTPPPKAPFFGRALPWESQARAGDAGAAGGAAGFTGAHHPHSGGQQQQSIGQQGIGVDDDSRARSRANRPGTAQRAQAIKARLTGLLDSLQEESHSFKKLKEQIALDNSRRLVTSERMRQEIAGAGLAVRPSTASSAALSSSLPFF